jgi:RNA polymerase sigma-70 factor (ECF subfamily)
VDTSDGDIVNALRAGNELAFIELVDRHSAAMLAVARRYVASPDVAEDVVQDTWVAVLKGIDGFEGRASLRTWLFRVLINIAKTRGVRDKRLLPVGTATDAGPTVPANRFRPAGDRWPGGWVRFPEAWVDSPERQLEASETLDVVRAALAALPELQRSVVALRDVEGYTSTEVCELLDLTAANQRVLLHRGRARVRAALACYLEVAS